MRLFYRCKNARTSYFYILLKCANTKAEDKMSNVIISNGRQKAVSEQDVEYVERKGIGHPDTLIDGIVEKAAVELSKAYMEKTGMVLHHNIDKGLIIGGNSEVGFGSGRITKPIEVIVAGRATREFKDIKFPVDQIILKAAEDYLKGHTRFLDIEKEVIIQSKVLKGSADLNGIFSRGTDVPLANDTSFGVGFAPLTETENLTLETERFLNSKEYKGKIPAVGEDIKVMGVRERDRITLTIAIAFVASLVKDINEYISYKERIVKDVLEHAKRYTDKEVEAFINYGDSHDNGVVYLTKSGLSCESGDDGQVGRGNRVNGLITPFRNMSLEAAAGKNPLNHVGKIYNVLAGEIARDVVKLYPQVKECSVSIVSQIGRPINDPKNLHIDLVLDKGEELKGIGKKISDIAGDYLENVGYITKEIIEGKHQIF